MSTETTLAPPPVLQTGAEALAAARAFASEIAAGAAARDRDRTPPLAELEALARTGLLGISVPRSHGGPELSRATIVEVLREIARGDSNVAQLVLSHFVLIEALRTAPFAEPAATVFGAILERGAQLGNATAERGTKHMYDRRTRATREEGPDGAWRLDGTKYYATGALGATYIGVTANVAPDHPVLAFVAPDGEGVRLSLEDWSSFGQRTTFSGTVQLDGAPVPPELVLDGGPVPAELPPSIFGAYDQALHAAIDVGIARAALEDGAEFVRTRTRPWFEAPSERASEEPHVLRRFGELSARLHAIEALLERAARTIDAALAAPELTDESTAAASLAVAETKALTQELAVEIASGIFELAGTSATDGAHGLDRHWRNVRTHSLHDPARWKYHHVGNHLLNGVLPPRNQLL